MPSSARDVFLCVNVWLAFGIVLEFFRGINPLIGILKIESSYLCQQDSNKIISHSLTAIQEQRLSSVIALFPSFAIECLGTTSLVKHVIEAEPETSSTKQRRYLIYWSLE